MTDSDIEKGLDETKPVYDDNERMRLFIRTNTDFYMNKWADIEEKREKWNWAGFLGGLFWLGYRKMYLYSFAVLGILLAYYSLTKTNAFDNIIGIVLAVLLGLNGNYLYYLHARSRIKKIVSLHLPEDEEKRLIQVSGGTSWIGVALVVSFVIAYAAAATLIIGAPQQ